MCHGNPFGREVLLTRGLSICLIIVVLLLLLNNLLNFTKHYLINERILDGPLFTLNEIFLTASNKVD